MMKRVLLTTVIAGATIGVVTPVSAAPPGGETLTLHCDQLGEIDVAIAPGQGEWTPGFVADGTLRLIPYAFEFEFEGQVEQISKPAPRHGRLDRCVFGDAEFSGTVWVSYTPH
jgi:hypothetical protein